MHSHWTLGVLWLFLLDFVRLCLAQLHLAMKEKPNQKSPQHFTPNSGLIHRLATGQKITPRQKSFYWQMTYLASAGGKLEGGDGFWGVDPQHGDVGKHHTLAVAACHRKWTGRGVNTAHTPLSRVFGGGVLVLVR